VSNFGSLAVYALQGFFEYRTDEFRILLDSSDRSRIEVALVESGHVSIPEEIVWSEYDGVSDFWQRNFPSRPPPTWFDRFFDWV
jgi:hypothetical protein